MKIRVEEASGKVICIPLPNSMLFSPTLLQLIMKHSNKHSDRTMPEIPPETIKSLCNTIKQFCKTHGDWELVHVESSSGNIISITI